MKLTELERAFIDLLGFLERDAATLASMVREFSLATTSDDMESGPPTRAHAALDEFIKSARRFHSVLLEEQQYIETAREQARADDNLEARNGFLSEETNDF